MATIHYQDLAFGITTIDTGFVRSGFDASHLIVEDGQAAFVDVGTSHTVPVLLEILRQKRIPPENVTYLIVTHIHLDHAGGAGVFLQHLPNAQLVVHPRGARHLVSPDKLIAGSTAVYGEDVMQAMFGEIVPVAEERVIEAGHQFTLALNGRQLVFLDTPGHARHHFCVVDEKSQGIFTGDTFGLSYREFDTAKGEFIFPACAPVHFDPESLHASIDLLMTYHPRTMYLTHFGGISDVARLADDLHESVRQFADFAQGIISLRQERSRQLSEGLEEILLARLKLHGCTLDREYVLKLLSPDLTLNVQGLEVWLNRLQKQKKYP